MATVSTALQKQTVRNVPQKKALALVVVAPVANAPKSKRRFSAEELNPDLLMNPEILNMLQNPPEDESGFCQ